MELFDYTAKQVRNDPDLLSQFIAIYKEVYGHEPNCAGCSVSREFLKLQQHIKSKNMDAKVIVPKTFVLKVLTDIHSYRKNGLTYRSYGRNMTEAFAVAYLTHGTPEEIEERKKYFSKLPEMEKDEVKEEPTDKDVEIETVTDYNAWTVPQIKTHLKAYDVEFPRSAKKADLIALIP